MSKTAIHNGIFAFSNVTPCVFAGGWDPKVHDFDEAACAGMLLFSFAVGQSTETQRKGIVFVHDLSGFGMQHVKAVKPGRLTQIVGLMQVRFTGSVSPPKHLNKMQLKLNPSCR